MPNLEPLPAQIIDYYQSTETEIAAIMLQLFGEKMDDQAFEIEPGKIIASGASERWDAPTDTRPGGGIALRLQSIPTIEILGKEASEEDRKRYRALLLEYGTLPDGVELDPEELDDAEDEVFNWRDYVLAVMDANDPDECHILNAATGAALDSEDMLRLRLVLSQWLNDRLQANYYDALTFDNTLETPMYKGRSFTYNGASRFSTEAPVRYSRCNN